MYSKIFWVESSRVVKYRWYGRSRLSVPKNLSTRAFPQQVPVRLMLVVILQVASNCRYFVAACYRCDPRGVGFRPWCPYASSMVKGPLGQIYGLSGAYSPADHEARVEIEAHGQGWLAL